MSCARSIMVLNSFRTKFALNLSISILARPRVQIQLNLPALPGSDPRRVHRGKVTTWVAVVEQRETTEELTSRTTLWPLVQEEFTHQASACRYEKPII